MEYFLAKCPPAPEVSATAFAYWVHFLNLDLKSEGTQEGKGFCSYNILKIGHWVGGEVAFNCSQVHSFILHFKNALYHQNKLFHIVGNHCIGFLGKFSIKISGYRFL